MVFFWIFIGMVLVWIFLLAYVYNRKPRLASVSLQETLKLPVDLGPSAGVCSIQGMRPHMEDTYQAKFDLNDNEKCDFFGVYDGHGGHNASVFASKHLHERVLEEDWTGDPSGALSRAMSRLDSDWLTLARTNEWDDGSTAVAGLIVNQTLYVANIGDSRAVLASGGKAVAMSSDHKPNREDEKRRIEGLGGRVIHYGTWRVEGVLAVSRAIGDRRLKKYVTADAEIMRRELTTQDTHLVLASDGVWDVLSSQAVVDIIERSTNVQEAARLVTEAALQLGSMDNITTLVIDFARYR